MTDPAGTAGRLVKTGGAAIVASVVRTLVPLVVGLVVAGLTKLGIPVAEADVALVVNGLVSAGIALAYYLLVRLLEVFASSKFGWLLGFAKSPVYVPGAVASAPSATVTVSSTPPPSARPFE